jgi:hypothetical protein
MEMIQRKQLLLLMVKISQLLIIPPAEEMMTMIVSIELPSQLQLLQEEGELVEVQKVNQAQKVLKVLPEDKVLLVNQVEPDETVEMEKREPSVIQVKLWWFLSTFNLLQVWKDQELMLLPKGKVNFLWELPD